MYLFLNIQKFFTMPNQHKSNNKKQKRLSPLVKDIWMYSLATLAVLVGWIITIIGLFLEPQGEIHSSVLIALGQSLVWGAAILGIPYYVKNEFGEFKSAIIKHVNKKLEVDDDVDEEDKKED